MREVQASRITEAVKEMCVDANYFLGDDMRGAFASAAKREESPAGLVVLEQLQENARLAAERRTPLCQDTGFSVFFVDVGQDVHVSGGGLEEAIQEGVRRGYREGLLRASIVDRPFPRGRTPATTPPPSFTRGSFPATGSPSSSTPRGAAART